ncbi:MAG: DUF5689 domain-containing protein [Muribaculaceae bacterium]|nr:DUF5689 domain-containing protein [Muribaculaceae bacterium]
MKKTLLYIAAGMMAATAFTACDDDFATPPAIVPEAVQVEESLPLADFKAQYWSSISAPTTVGFMENGDSIILVGRVCSSDESGNIFKNIVVQSVDENGEQVAIALSINAYDLYQTWRFGQKVAIYASGMQIGGYRNLLQFGAISGNEMTFMDESMAKEHIVRAIEPMPEPEKVVTTEATLAEIAAAKADDGARMLWQSRRVKVSGVSFVDAGKPCATGQNENRYVTDEDGNRLNVRMSAYADFKSKPLPYGKGSVTGILSYYASDWQLMINDYDDLADFDGEGGDNPGDTPGGPGTPEGEGTLESPYNVAKVLAIIADGSNDEEKEVYVKGKIKSIKEIDTSNYGNASYYITDEGTSNEFYIFRGYSLGNKKFTSQDEIAVGAEVVILGKVINYMGNTPEMAQGNYIVSYNGQGGDTPTPPTPGNFTGTAPVSILASSLNVAGTAAIADYGITISKAGGFTDPVLRDNGAIRLYNGNTISVAGGKLTSIKFILADDAHFRYTTVKCSTGKIEPAQAAGDTEFTWVGDATEVTFTVDELATLGDESTQKGQIRFKQLDINGGGEIVGGAPVTADYTCTAASSIESGAAYVLVVDGQYGAAIGSSLSYGRLNLTNANISGGSFDIAAANVITFTEEAGKGYTMKDSYGRFLGMDAEHFTSFQLYTAANEGCYWTAAFEGGKIRLTNTLNTTCFVCVSQGTEGTFYTNMAPAAAPEAFKLPELYKAVKK